MRMFWKNQKGVTMIEVLVTVGLLAIIIVPCLSSFVVAQRGNALAEQTYNEYTEAQNLVESLKAMNIPEDSTWKTEMEKKIAGVKTDKTDGISVFGNFDDANQYYVIRIYVGEMETEPAGEGADLPLLKGVIAP